MKLESCSRILLLLLVTSFLQESYCNLLLLYCCTHYAQAQMSGTSVTTLPLGYVLFCHGRPIVDRCPPITTTTTTTMPPTTVKKSANILFFHLLSSYSHRIAIWPLVEALADRGHNVTFLQSYPPKIPNPKINEYYPASLAHVWDLPGDDLSMFQLRVLQGPWGTRREHLGFHFMAYDICDKFLSAPEIDHFVMSSTFDLVVVDNLGNECAYGLAHKWGAKTIVYSSSPLGAFWGIETHGFLGTSEPWISEQILIGSMPMGFWARVSNMLIFSGTHLVKELIYYPRLRALFERKLNISNLPPVQYFLEDTALILYNSHYSEEEARTLPPKYVAVPALHVWDTVPEALPKDISDFIEANDDTGFIYVSFGAQADISSATIDFQNIFFQAFANIKLGFIWKRSEDSINHEIPANVFLKDWMPQKDILASPKCKGFLTHGGMLGIQESIMSGVPMILMPIFAEQEYNAMRQERTGRGLRLEAHGLTEGHLRDAILKLLKNDSYKLAVEKTRKELLDQQNKPLDTAVFWTEYVLRNDMLSLKPGRIGTLYWYQAYFLDVFAFITLIIFILAAFSVYLVKFTYSSFFVKRPTQKIKTK